MRPHRRQPTRLPHPWDSPGKNTGVGCHFLLQCMQVESESEVTQPCPTLATPWTAAYQAPPSMGLSRQEYWSGVPLPSPVSHLGSPQLRHQPLHQLSLPTVLFHRHYYYSIGKIQGIYIQGKESLSSHIETVLKSSACLR